MNNDERVTKLEIKVAFLEDTIEKLSDEIFLKNRQIEKIQVQILDLASQINKEDVKDIEKPPHY